MRIGMDIRELERGVVTGIGRHLRYFLGYVDEHDRDNEYILFGNQHTEFTPEHDHLQVKIIPENIRVVWDQVVLPAAIHREGVELFVSPYFKAPLFHGARKLTIINDIIPLTAGGNPLLHRLYFRIMAQCSSMVSDLLISNSQSTKDDYVRVFHVPEKKIVVGGAAIDPRFTRIDLGVEERMKSFGIDSKFLLYVGNLNPHKNVPSLLKGYAGLAEPLRAQYRLVIVARKSGQFAKIEKLIQELGIGPQVTVADSVTDEDLPYFYNAATAFVFPSRYEGFGLPVAEAMACGTPVITSNVSSMPEVAGDAGLLIDPDKPEEITAAIEKILSDDDLRHQLTEQGVERASAFTIEALSQRTLDVFRQLDAKRGKAAV